MADVPPSHAECVKLRSHLLRAPPVIFGAGAIGRQVALQLVGLGIAELRVFDSRRVNQSDVFGGFRPNDIGRPRADVLAELCFEANPRLNFQSGQMTMESAVTKSSAVFCCVDTVNERRRIWKLVQSCCGFWSDVRTIRSRAYVFMAFDQRSRRRYARLLRSRASPGGSGRRTTPANVCIACVAASIAVYQLVSFLRRRPVPFEVDFDVATGRASNMGGDGV